MTTKKTPNQANSNGYFAVRKGKGGLKLSCIFLTWEDCRGFVLGDDDDNDNDSSAEAEYHVFDTLEEAAAYLRARPVPQADLTQKAATTPASKRKKKQPPSPPPPPHQEAAKAPAAKEGSSSPLEDDAQLLASIAAVVDEHEHDHDDRSDEEGASDSDNSRRSPTTKPPSKRRRIIVADDEAYSGNNNNNEASSSDNNNNNNNNNNEVQVVKTRKRRPTKKWESFFSQLTTKAYEEAKAKAKEGSESDVVVLVNVDVDVDVDDEKLERWMEDQRYQYKLIQQGKPSSMYDEKIDRLRSIGFEFTPTPVVKQEDKNKKRNIYKTWEENIVKLKAYMDAHGGSYDIDAKDEENAKLREWVQQQQYEYKKMVEGNRDTRMTKQKVQRLQELGFQFTYVSWEERLEQLKAYKQEHGHFNVPVTHQVLGKWMKSLRQKCKLFLEGKNPRDITPERVAQLKELGFDPTKRRDAKTEEQEKTEWEQAFAMLAAFKEQHGHCQVTRAHGKVELHNWVILQRVAYKNLQQGKPSKLTAQRLMRLNEIGFLFSQKGSYKQWDDRFEELRQFKEANGHLNIPSSHPELGEFVARQRVEYRKRLDGLKTPMTDERIQALESLGFNFDVGQRHDKSTRRTPPKSWDERFQELQDFKEEFGHTVVPQHSNWMPGLGSWVKAQRMGYKLLQSGKKTSMTAEKALKLANIGFVFEVLDQNRRRKRSEFESDEE